MSTKARSRRHSIEPPEKPRAVPSKKLFAMIHEYIDRCNRTWQQYDEKKADEDGRTMNKGQATLHPRWTDPDVLPFGDDET